MSLEVLCGVCVYKGQGSQIQDRAVTRGTWCVMGSGTGSFQEEEDTVVMANCASCSFLSVALGAFGFSLSCPVSLLFMRAPKPVLQIWYAKHYQDRDSDLINGPFQEPSKIEVGSRKDRRTIVSQSLSYWYKQTLMSLNTNDPILSDPSADHSIDCRETLWSKASVLHNVTYGFCTLRITHWSKVPLTLLHASVL